MPTFLELAYDGNYVGHGFYVPICFIFTYKGKVFMTCPDQITVELIQAKGLFVN